MRWRRMSHHVCPFPIVNPVGLRDAPDADNLRWQCPECKTIWKPAVCWFASTEEQRLW